MDYSALKARLNELYPEPAPLSASDLDAAWTTISAETVPLNPTEYRATALTLANELELTVAVRVIATLRAVAAADTALSPLVDEMLRLMRANVGVDVKNPKTAAVMLAIGISSSDVAAVVAMGITTTPKYPGLTIADLERARSLS